jgi:hypothetical protein
MPGTFAVDQTATFMSAVLVNSGAKPKFGAPGQQETNSAGVPKWTAQVAVTFTPTMADMQPLSELITITITAPANPAEQFPPGTPVVLDGLRVGLNPPEKNDHGGIKGGKLWYTAIGLHPVMASRGRSESAA